MEEDRQTNGAQAPMSRRRFLKAATAGAVATIPVTALLQSGTAMAKPKAEDGYALNYVRNAADAEGQTRWAPGQTCRQCVFWDGYVEEPFGHCRHPQFEDVLVHDQGWCSVYAPA